MHKDILQQIHSQDSNQQTQQPIHQQSPPKTQTTSNIKSQTQLNYFNDNDNDNSNNNSNSNRNSFDDQQLFQIRQTIDFGQRKKSNKQKNKKRQNINNYIDESKSNKKIKNIKIQIQQSSGSDFGGDGDTDQILDFVDKNRKIYREQKVQYKDIKHNQNIGDKFGVYNNKNEKTSAGNKFTPYYYNQLSSKIQQQKNTTKHKIPEPQINPNLTTQQQQQLIIHMSMIGQRGKPSNFNLSYNKKQQQRQHKQKQQQQKQKQKQKYPLTPNYQINQSIYLTSNKKQQQIVKNQVILKVMDDTMYWVFQNKEIKVNSETLEALVQQFFKKEVMLPLISDVQYKSQNITNYIHVYTKFLNDFFPNQFKQIFNNLKSKLSNSANPVTPKSSHSTLKNLFNSYMPKFLQSSYSKSELLRDFLLKKLSTLKILQKLNKQKQVEKAVINQKIKSIQYQISVLELLVSFENSESYCKNYSKQGIDHRIWKQHAKKIGELRKKFIDKLENQENDYSFII